MKKKSDNFEFIELTDKAQDIAGLIRDKMETVGTYSVNYDHVIEMLASCIDNYNRCATVVNSSGFSEMTEKGGMKTMPEASLMSQFASLIKMYSEQLMLTPKTSGNVKPKERNDDIADIINLTKVG